MWEPIEKGLMGIFGAIITLAIISVIVSKRAQSAAVIQASSSALANVVSAAVNPVGSTANNGLNSFSMPPLH